VVLELVGAPNLAGDLDALAIGGRIAVIGVGGGATGELNLSA
jgi:NADPH2:quinone reductase